MFAMVLALVTWRGVLQLSLSGWDTFPMIAAGRIESWSGFVDSIASELMAGRFPGGHYWRPLVHATFGADHALWGLEPFGYHLTDLAIFVLTTTAIVWLARALVGEARARWAYLAGLVYALHPVHFEIVPLPPRRADALALLFTLLALLAALRKLGGTSWLAALFAALALAAKETGALVVPLLFACGCMQPRGVVRERVLSGVRASWPALAVLGLYFAARARIVEGLGGGARASLEGAGGELSRVATRYAELVLTPLPPAWVPEGLATLIIAGALVVFLGAAAARVGEPEGEAQTSPRAAVGLLALWLVALLAVTGVAGIYRAWYALPFVAPLALLTAVAAASVRAQRGAGAIRVFGGLTILALLQGWMTSDATRWSELERTSDAASRFLSHFDDVVQSLKPGSIAELSAYPAETADTRHGRETAKTMLFREYSLQAYAELAHPTLEIRVAVKRSDEELRAGPNEVLVLLIPRSSADDGVRGE
ncbi:MAG: hypothetical protein IT454_22320 [Planctomycetes bacterium]|nr:hypothetical protein [Planctomycetota bacterium]